MVGARRAGRAVLAAAAPVRPRFGSRPSPSPGHRTRPRPRRVPAGLQRLAPRSSLLARDHSPRRQQSRARPFCRHRPRGACEGWGCGSWAEAPGVREARAPRGLTHPGPRCPRCASSRHGRRESRALLRAGPGTALSRPGELSAGAAGRRTRSMTAAAASFLRSFAVACRVLCLT